MNLSVPKIKSILIGALVIINLLFLILIVSGRIADATYVRQAVLDACSVLENNGITINPDDIKQTDEIKSMRTVRELAAEERIAEAVLGPVTMPDQGGGAIYRFENEENGSAVFRSGGDFSITIKADVIKNRSGAVDTVKKLLKSMNLESNGLFLTGRFGLETVTAVCAYKKIGIFNCTIQFIFNGDSLVSVVGRWVSGIEPVVDGIGISSPATALMSFLAAVKRGELVCSRIDSVENGYHFRETSAFGNGVLIPVWLIIADSGWFVVDTNNNEIHTISAIF